MTEDKSRTSSTPPPPMPNSNTATNTGNIVTSLLKAPSRVADAIAHQRKELVSAAVSLLVVAVVCHAVFGFAVGLFGGWSVALMDVVKAPLVAVCSLLLCFPSLYVFACVAGSPLSISQTVALGCSCLAMVGLLLVGLAPVAWLFAVSTESLSFIVILTLFIWLIALSFAARYVGKLRANPLFQKQAGIKMWFLILIIVTLQMTTCMRPMLAKPEKGWWTGGKQFFLSHFGSTFEKKK
ncbi:MAG: hypothetical protein R6V03_09760 [Kiritimatiellia bacterium]